jgi:hypothetical protein
MGIIVKLADREPIIINGDSIAYAEGGNVLEILNEAEEMLAAFRNWEYAIVQESEEEYQRSVAELDDEEDEDLEEDDDVELDDDEDLEEEGDEEEPSPNGAASDLGELVVLQDADILARLAADDGAPTN